MLQEVEGQERPAGYYQRFGVTGTTEEEILAVIRDYLRKDLASKIIEVENQGEPDFENLDAEIRGRVGNVGRLSIKLCLRPLQKVPSNLA